MPGIMSDPVVVVATRTEVHDVLHADFPRDIQKVFALSHHVDGIARDQKRTVDALQGRPCILDQTNASRKTLDLIADKWTILVLFGLRNGKRRFAELRREIRGVTEKMLIQTLRNLERDGIVARKVYPTVPPRVEYSISELGWSLAPILDAIIDWS